MKAANPKFQDLPVCPVKVSSQISLLKEQSVKAFHLVAELAKQFDEVADLLDCDSHLVKKRDDVPKFNLGLTQCRNCLLRIALTNFLSLEDENKLVDRLLNLRNSLPKVVKDRCFQILDRLNSFGDVDNPRFPTRIELESANLLYFTLDISFDCDHLRMYLLTVFDHLIVVREALKYEVPNA